MRGPDPDTHSNTAQGSRCPAREGLSSPLSTSTPSYPPAFNQTQLFMSKDSSSRAQVWRPSVPSSIPPSVHSFVPSFIHLSALPILKCEDNDHACPTGMACGLPPGERRSSQLHSSALPMTRANGGQRNLADGAGNTASALSLHSKNQTLLCQQRSV